MDFLTFFLFMTILIGLVGSVTYFALQAKARQKQSRQFPYRRYDEDEPVGEKKHCDAYSAGTFTW